MDKQGLSYFSSIYFFLCVFILSVDLNTQNVHQELNLPLSDTSGLKIKGPYRFVEIAGITGLNIKSLNTKASIETTSLNAKKGTVSLWMSPLESIDISREAGHTQDLMTFPLLSDKFPARKSDSCNFSIYYRSSGYPRVITRFNKGNMWEILDYGLAPFVYAESLPLQKGQWYHLVITWNKETQVLILYINGQMVGHNFSANNFSKVEDKLYIGNPLMVISHLKVVNTVLSDSQVRKEYLTMRPVTNDLSDNTIRKISTLQDRPVLDMKLDSSWKKIYECEFSKPSDMDDWQFQTGDLFYNQFKLEVTNEGLFWETPDTIHTQSRGYLWCPVRLEGDCCVEYEFQLMSPRGLSLLIVYASGLHGEDVIDDHGLRKTGSMSDMLTNYRNYHWEYVRRVEAMRTDVETQYVNKNPWGKNLYVGCIPRLEQNRWYKIRFIKIGNQLRGVLDNKIVFDVADDPYDNNGPVFNSGRVVLRQMYHTAMRYRNFVIYRINDCDI
jgi:hypothetical protein